MELIKFSRIKDDIDEFLTDKPIDYFYLGIENFISEKYNFLKDYATFSDWCVNHYEKISLIIDENKMKMTESKKTIQNIEKSMKETLLTIEKLHDKDILNERIKRMEVKNKKEKEIQTILSIENTESYKAKINSLRNEIAELEKWLTDNSPNELEIKISTKNNEKITLEKQLEIAHNELKESTEILEDFNEKIEFNSIEYIINILFKTISSVKKVEVGHYNSKKFRLELHENKYYDKPITISSHALKGIIMNQNNLYEENWKELITNYFNKPLNLSELHTIKKVKNFPDWGFKLIRPEIKTEIEPVVVAIWLSMQNIDFTKFLITSNKKIFLWISDYIFVEIVLRQPIKKSSDLIAIYCNEDNEYKFVEEKIVGGYTSSGYYLPHWIYIVDKEIIIELFFHQNALLSKYFSKEKLFDNQRKSVERMEEERLRDDD